MAGNGIANVIGTDGISPSYRPDDRWCYWEMDEIYKGEIGLKKHIPKVGDYVVDKNSGEQFIVDRLNTVSYVSFLRKVQTNTATTIFSETDVLFGGTSNSPTDTYRIYIDKSTTPYTLAVDKRCKIYGSEAKYAKIFNGSHLSSDSHVVSRVYDSSGKLVSEEIGLELVAVDNHTTYHVKSVMVCSTNDDLLDGDIVTIVIYGEGGYVVYKRQLIVENTSFIRSVNASRKYISSISLECGFLSPTNDNIILFPFNMSDDSLNLVGVLHYSDGSTSKKEVDGIKFRMYGIDNYIHDAVGQKADLVLAYMLDGEETTYSGVNTDNTYLTRPYSLITIQPDLSLVVKLFCYPIWNKALNKYVLQWWLFSLSRNLYYDVTTFIKPATNTATFVENDYNTLQRISVTLQLRDVSATFKSFIHRQTVDIRLYGVPSIPTSSWVVAHEVNQNHDLYGTNLKARLVGDGIVNLSNGFTSPSVWLKNLYKTLYVLIDVVTEVLPPEPTHFTLNCNGSEVNYSISQWADNLPLNNISLYDTVNIRFTRTENSQILELGMAALIVK